MEPCVDPAQEIQACGRIHRLGQEQDCYIRRFAFKDSIEEAVIELHDKIKAGAVKVVDGRLDETASRDVLQAFQKDKVMHDHSGMQRERKWSQNIDLYSVSHEEVHGEGAVHSWSYSAVVPPGEKNGRTRSVIWRDEDKAYRENNVWQATCKQAACVCCGLFADLPGTYKWSGTGVFEYLNGDKRDPPKAWPSSIRAERFSRIPRPPDGWRGLALDQTDNGGELPAADDSAAADSAAASAAADLAAPEETSATPESGSAAPALELGSSASHATVGSPAGSAHGGSSSA